MSQDNIKTYLTDYSPSDSSWDDHKSSTDKISYFYNTSFDSNHHKYSARMDGCAELLRFHFIDTPEGESKLKLNRASFCRVRLCPVCQWRRSMAWRGKMFNKLPSLLKEHPEYEFIFLTLTVKNCEITKLSDTLTEMNLAWKKLISLKSWKKSIHGFLRATEVTKGADGSAHPHFHCILVVKKSYFKGGVYIKTAQWAEMWQQSLKVDYLPICDVRKVKKQADGLEIKAICELLKYTTKIKDLLDDKSWFLELSDQLHKKRFLASGGCLKDMLKEEATTQEMIAGDTVTEPEGEEEELRKISLYFGWNQPAKKYKKVKNPYSGD